jgi:hypothetical protein
VLPDFLSSSGFGTLCSWGIGLPIGYVLSKLDCTDFVFCCVIKHVC